MYLYVCVCCIKLKELPRLWNIRCTFVWVCAFFSLTKGVGSVNLLPSSSPVSKCARSFFVRQQTPLAEIKSPHSPFLAEYAELRNEHNGKFASKSHPGECGDDWLYLRSGSICRLYDGKVNGKSVFRASHFFTRLFTVCFIPCACWFLLFHPSLIVIIYTGKGGIVSYGFVLLLGLFLSPTFGYSFSSPLVSFAFYTSHDGWRRHGCPETDAASGFPMFCLPLPLSRKARKTYLYTNERCEENSKVFFLILYIFVKMLADTFPVLSLFFLH